MSAFLCSDYHIATMAQYIASLHGSIDAQILANKLKRINIHSVNYRYSEKSKALKCKMDKIMEISAHDFTRLYNCWDYQSCENQLDIDYQIMRGFLKHYASKGDRKFSSVPWGI